MATQRIALDRQPFARGAEEASQLERVIHYYSEAGDDYENWSECFNMHFGYYKPGMNPFNLEAMLNQMNREVLDRLGLVSTQVNHILDMGCGLGATARYAASAYPEALINGVTIVPWQIRKARELAEQKGMGSRICFSRSDYSNTPFDKNSFNGVYAVESACYAHGYDKADFLREAHRVLKPGSKLVVADGFYKGSGPRNPLLQFACDKVCEGWALETFAEIGAFKASLEKLGFTNIVTQEISWNLAPSVMHIPAVALKFLYKELLVKKSNMTPARWGHVFAPLLGLVVGAARTRYGYYLVSATKA